MRYSNANQRGDLCQEDGGNLQLDDGLISAVEVSLFTDQRAPDGEELPDPKGSRRGWWGDMFAGVDNPERLGDEWGSLLWLRLSRGKSRQQTYNLIRSDILAALQWLIDDGVAASVAASVFRAGADRIGFTVEIKRPENPSRKWVGRWEVVLAGGL